MNKEELDKLVNQYAEEKTLYDSYAKKMKTSNEKLKSVLKEEDLSEYINNTYKVTLVQQSADKLNENKLIEELKKILTDEQKENIIKTKEYVDNDALEDAIYNHVIKTDVVSTCIEHKEPIYKLMIKRRK